MTVHQHQPHPPELTQKQRQTLEDFAWLNVELDEVKRQMHGVLEFNFEGDHRFLNCSFLVPQPGIPITRHHIEAALSKRREGIVSESALVQWATMLLLNDAYEFDEQDEDLLAEWLNNISYDLGSSREVS